MGDIILLVLMGLAAWGMWRKIDRDTADWTSGENGVTSWQSMLASVDALNLSDQTDTDDMYFSPIFSHHPGNIHNDDMFDSDSCSTSFDGPDYIHDPMYSYMPQNIFHDDD